MPYYGEGASSPYYLASPFANHSSLMTGIGRYHNPIAARYSPHLSTISESPLVALRRYTPATPSTTVISSIARPRRIIDTADIDVSKPPRSLAQESRPQRHRLRRDRPTIKIRSQALKDNPALREYNERHEKSVGDLLVEKFLIKDSKPERGERKMKLYHQASLLPSALPGPEAKGHEDEIFEAIRRRVTRRMTRRRSSADVQALDPAQIEREAVLQAAQAEVLDTLVAEEQAEIEVEVRRGTFAKRQAMRLPIETAASESEDDARIKKRRKSLEKSGTNEVESQDEDLEIPESLIEEDEFEWDERDKCDDVGVILPSSDSEAPLKEAAKVFEDGFDLGKVDQDLKKPKKTPKDRSQGEKLNQVLKEPDQLHKDKPHVEELKQFNEKPKKILEDRSQSKKLDQVLKQPSKVLEDKLVEKLEQALTEPKKDLEDKSPVEKLEQIPKKPKKDLEDTSRVQKVDQIIKESSKVVEDKIQVNKLEKILDEPKKTLEEKSEVESSNRVSSKPRKVLEDKLEVEKSEPVMKEPSKDTPRADKPDQVKNKASVVHEPAEQKKAVITKNVLKPLRAVIKTEESPKEELPASDQPKEKKISDGAKEKKVKKLNRLKRTVSAPQQPLVETSPTFKVEACNSVGDFSTLYIKAAATSSPQPVAQRTIEQFRESIRLPAPRRVNHIETQVVLPVRRAYVRDTSRNSVYLALKPAAAHARARLGAPIAPDETIEEAEEPSRPAKIDRPERGPPPDESAPRSPAIERDRADSRAEAAPKPRAPREDFVSWWEDEAEASPQPADSPKVRVVPIALDLGDERAPASPRERSPRKLVEKSVAPRVEPVGRKSPAQEKTLAPIDAQKKEEALPKATIEDERIPAAEEQPKPKQPLRLLESPEKSGSASPTQEVKPSEANDTSEAIGNESVHATRVELDSEAIAKVDEKIPVESKVSSEAIVSKWTPTTGTKKGDAETVTKTDKKLLEELRSPREAIDESIVISGKVAPVTHKKAEAEVVASTEEVPKVAEPATKVSDVPKAAPLTKKKKVDTEAILKFERKILEEAESPNKIVTAAMPEPKKAELQPSGEKVGLSATNKKSTEPGAAVRASEIDFWSEIKPEQEPKEVSGTAAKAQSSSSSPRASPGADLAAPALVPPEEAPGPVDPEPPAPPTRDSLDSEATGTVVKKISKWANHDNLSRAPETTPIGSQNSTPQGSTTKKKVVKRKKSSLAGKKPESSKAGTKKAAAKKVAPSPQATLTKTPMSAAGPPRNAPGQRPEDLKKLFYTTPAILLTATPRDLQKVRRAKAKKKKPPSRTPSMSSDSTGSTRSTATTSTEEGSNCEEDAEHKRLASTRSNDSGFDGSPRLYNCDMVCHKKCEKLTGNLCGLNQKLVAEALQALKKAPSQSSENQRNVESEHYPHSGRITPPATNLPRFKKYEVTDFNFLKVLGKGSFGKVLLAELRDTECVYAVKCLKKDVVLEDDDVECTLIERKVLTLATRHPYLCHLFCTFQTESHLFFVMEYLNGGDLMFHIQKSGRFSEPRAKFYAAEIWSGLIFLHKKGIVYRDLKLDNVLLDFEGHIRIADFGMCKLQIFLDRTADTFCGTPDYMAPEIIKGLKYNQAVDWWSFGVLLYEMLTGQSPFSGCDEDELFWSICNERPFIPRYLSQSSTDILVALLEKDAGKRIPGHEIACHPFFCTIAWDKLERRTLEAPFKPAVEHTLDTRYFDTAFTAERPRLTPVPEPILTSMDQAVFRGFSYTNPNATD